MNNIIKIMLSFILVGSFVSIYAQENPFSSFGEPTEHEKAGQCIEGSELTCLALDRKSKDGKNKKVLIIRTGTSDETGIYAICTPQEDEKEKKEDDSSYTGIFSEKGGGGIRIVIDQNIIKVPLAKVIQQKTKNNQEEQNNGQIEATGGQAQFLEIVPEKTEDSLIACGIDYKPTLTQSAVQIKQGNTFLTGTQLNYESIDGIARVKGPIQMNRYTDDPLSGKSDQLEVNTDNEAISLIGNVEITIGERTSSAARVEYNDTRGEAKLYATKDFPAQTKKDTEWIKITSGYIYYNLKTNEVVIRNADVKGQFQD